MSHLALVISVAFRFALVCSDSHEHASFFAAYWLLKHLLFSLSWAHVGRRSHLCGRFKPKNVADDLKIVKLQ